MCARSAQIFLHSIREFYVIDTLKLSLMNILKPLSSATIAKEVVAVYQSTMRDMARTDRTTPTRVLYLRPSQLPFCPLEFFVQNSEQGLFRTLDFAGAFYTSVGTVVHEVMQEFLCRSGKFLADYHCEECGEWFRSSYMHEHCGFPTKYHEIEINYKGIQGHIDAVYRDKDGKLWILDFKTTSIDGAPKKQKDPGVTYIEQIETYAVLFELQYGLPIEGIMDAFIIRDNPRKSPAIYAKKLTDEQRRSIKSKLTRYKRMHREALDVQTWSEVSALFEHGRCTNPYCSVCKLDDKLIMERLKSAYKTGKAKGRVPIRDYAEAELAKGKSK